MLGVWCVPSYVRGRVYLPLRGRGMRVGVGFLIFIPSVYPCLTLHIDTFKTVAHFLVDLAEKEIKFGGKEVFTRWRGHAAAFKAQFLGEFKAYACHQFPFNLPVDKKKGVLKWWQGLIGCQFCCDTPGAAFSFSFLATTTLILWQHLAIKIYSIHVNSMPEERMVSTFTWLTLALCSQLSVSAMTAMTQITNQRKRYAYLFFLMFIILITVSLSLVCMLDQNLQSNFWHQEQILLEVRCS